SVWAVSSPRSITCSNSSGAFIRSAAQAAASVTWSAYGERSTHASTLRSAFMSAASRSVTQDDVVGAVLVVHAELVDHRRARLVHAAHLHFRAFAPELQHDLVERAHRRDVPEMGATHVDADLVDHFLVVEGVGKALGRSEEDLSQHLVVAHAAVVLAARGDPQ